MTNNNSASECKCKCKCKDGCTCKGKCQCKCKCKDECQGCEEKCFQIYKQQWDMIEKVNEQRGRVNTLYTTLFTAIIAAIGYAIFEYAIKNPTLNCPVSSNSVDFYRALFLLVGLAGTVLAVPWFFQVCFYGKLISVKLCLLQKMEARLQIFPFTAQEDNLLLKWLRGWPPLLPPILFFVIFGTLLIWSRYDLCALPFLTNLTLFILSATLFLFCLVCCCTCCKCTRRK